MGVGRNGQASLQLELDLGSVRVERRLRSALPLRDSLLFAAVPNHITASRFAELARKLQRRHGLRGEPRSADLLHLTLSPLGAYSSLPEEIVFAALQAGSMVEATPFQITLDRVMSFRSQRKWPLVLRCGGCTAGVVALQKALMAAIRAVHLQPALRFSFTPHVTLLYDVESVPETLLDEPITWTVRDFVLVHGLQGRGHLHLARWPLRGRDCPGSA